jgi:hypothetical protein
MLSLFANRNGQYDWTSHHVDCVWDRCATRERSIRSGCRKVDASFRYRNDPGSCASRRNPLVYLLQHYVETRKLTNNLTVIKMPSWLRGASFERYARKWYPIVRRSVKNPYDKVKAELVSTTRHPLFTTSDLRLCRRPGQQLPQLPQTPYRASVRILPRKTYGSPDLFQDQCIWQVLTR